MTTRLTVIALVIAVILLLIVLELVRRNRLMERYALLWLATMTAVVFFAAWPSALDRLAQTVGVAYPPSALFVLASGFFMLMLLHFSMVLSKLSHSVVVLAQECALLERRLRELEDGDVRADP